MSLVPKKQGKNNSGSWIIFAVIFFIVTFPFSLILVIIGVIAYSVITGQATSQNGGKLDAKVFKKIKTIGTIYEGFKKSSTLPAQILQKVEDEIFQALLVNKRVPNESLLDEKIKNIFRQNGLHGNIKWQQHIIAKASSKFTKMIKEQEQQKIKEENSLKKYNYHKNKNNLSKRKKYTSKKTPTSSNFKSIWDDYESVIDIMEKGK